MTNNMERDTEADIQPGEELSEPKSRRIIKLEVENVKRIQAVAIEPDGSVVVVGGKNGAGKTSAIDAIAYALGGKKLCPDEPLRRGEDRGVARVDLDDYTVERIFTKGKPRGELVIKNTEGFKAGSPQKLLDKIVGDLQLGFDPVSFVDRMDRAQQLDVLKELVGVDCSDLKEKRDHAYEQRTQVNRDVKKLKAQLDSMPLHEDAPDEEESASFLLGELDRRREVNERNDSNRRELSAMMQTADEFRNEIDSLNREIDDLQRRRDERAGQFQVLQDNYATQKKVVDSFVDENLDEIRQRIDAAEELNRRVRENATRATVSEGLEVAHTISAGHTKYIDECDAEKEARLGSAQFPVDGLSFDDNGVTLGGLPFDQASRAEQLRVAVSIAFASGSDLRIALVRDGSLLDDDSLALLHELADDAGGQVWLERVGAGPEVTVLIEDGKVAG